MHAQLNRIPQQTVQLLLRLPFGSSEWFSESPLYRGAHRPESVRRHLAIPVAKNGAWKQFADVAINGVRRRNAVEPQVASDRVAVNLAFEGRVHSQTLKLGGE